MVVIEGGCEIDYNLFKEALQKLETCTGTNFDSVFFERLVVDLKGRAAEIGDGFAGWYLNLQFNGLEANAFFSVAVKKGQLWDREEKMPNDIRNEVLADAASTIAKIEELVGINVYVR